MASINREPNGRRTVQFIGADGKRRSVRLGKVPQRTAEAIKVRIEHLAIAAATGAPWNPKRPNGSKSGDPNCSTSWPR